MILVNNIKMILVNNINYLFLYNDKATSARSTCRLFAGLSA
jgi:hypothetical protein